MYGRIVRALHNSVDYRYNAKETCHLSVFSHSALILRAIDFEHLHWNILDSNTFICPNVKHHLRCNLIKIVYGLGRYNSYFHKITTLWSTVFAFASTVSIERQSKKRRVTPRLSELFWHFSGLFSCTISRLRNVWWNRPAQKHLINIKILKCWHISGAMRVFSTFKDWRVLAA